MTFEEYKENIKIENDFTKALNDFTTMCREANINTLQYDPLKEIGAIPSVECKKRLESALDNLDKLITAGKNDLIKELKETCENLGNDLLKLIDCYDYFLRKSTNKGNVSLLCDCDDILNENTPINEVFCRLKKDLNIFKQHINENNETINSEIFMILLNYATILNCHGYK